MAQLKDRSVRRFLEDFFGDAHLRQLCIKSGVCRRRSKLDPVALLISIILHVQPSLQRMLDIFIQSSGQTLARSSFYERLSGPLQYVMRTLLDESQQRALARPLGRQQRRAIRPFTDMFAVDCTVLVLRDGLHKVYKGTRQTFQAAMKVLTVVRILSTELVHHRMDAERTHDSKMLKTMKLVAGALYLFDQGFSGTALWRRFTEAQAYLLCPLHPNFNPVLQGGPCAGRRVRDVLAHLKAGLFEAECEFAIRKPPHATKTKETLTLRVVAVQKPHEPGHYVYVTNVPKNMLRAEKLHKLYALRWQAEIHYKLTKSELGLEALPSANSSVVRTLVRAALLRCCCAMAAKLVAERFIPKDRWINPYRWTMVWSDALPTLLMYFFLRTKPPDTLHFDQLARRAIDPNRKRLPARFQLFPQLRQIIS